MLSCVGLANMLLKRIMSLLLESISKQRSFLLAIKGLSYSFGTLRGKKDFGRLHNHIIKGLLGLCWLMGLTTVTPSKISVNVY